MARPRVYFLVWRKQRWMPLLLGLFLVAGFIWVAENIGTLTKTWIYPSQRNGWSLVGLQKLGSWFLLLIISYTLVALIRRGPEIRRASGLVSGTSENMGAAVVPNPHRLSVQGAS